MQLSNKIQSMELSPIRKFVPYADAARAQGKKVYGLNIGQPDIKTPRAFFDTVKNFDQEVLAYENSQGNAKLLESLVGYYKRIGLNFEKKDLLITNGGSEALSMLMTAMLNEGDEVIMAEPFYTNYKTFIKAAGGELVAIPTTADDGYQYAVKEKIEAVITPKTKAIAIINPGNPTGKVLTHDEMQLIVDIVVKHDLFLICDEVYREFGYEKDFSLKSSLQFDGYEETVRTDLWVIEDPEKPPLVYEDVSVVRGYAFNDEIKNYLIIRPVEPAGRMNRRGAYRVKVGVPCKVYCKEGYVNGYVRDVSTSGFGIEIKHGQVQDGSVKGNITIEFTDSSIDKNAITISGTCVRKQDKETYTIFGCRISQDTIAYNSYVMKKQAQKARVKDI